MQNIEGLYTNLNALIAKKEDEGRIAITVDDLETEIKSLVDIYSASLDWYIRFALRAAAENVLYQKGYRSVIKGNGIFVNVQNCTKPEYMSRLFNNAKMTEIQKRQVVAMIKNRIDTLGIPGQLQIDAATGTIVETISEAKLMEMLIRDAREAI